MKIFGGIGKCQKNQCMLMILDGFGIAPKSEGNAVTLAKKPNLDKLFEKYPTSELQASGITSLDYQKDKWEIQKLDI